MSVKRAVDLNEISDGSLYGANDMVRADCGGCTGCSACCRGMGSSVILDPLDIYRLCAGLKLSLIHILRKIMTKETIQHNADCFYRQLSRFIKFDNDSAIIENNANWLLNLNYVDFLREVGAHFSVNRMLTAECYKQRMEKGLTFFEFNYMVMQSYDFLVLNQKYGCCLEMGGNDQWSNIIGGVEMCIRDRMDDYSDIFSVGCWSLRLYGIPQKAEQETAFRENQSVLGRSA